MLMKARLGLVAAVLIGAAIPSAAQVNFGGEWQLVEGLEPSSADYRSPIGARGVIVQEAGTVTLTSPREGARRFNLDGSATVRVTTSPAGEPFTATSRVHWISSALLITTVHTRPSLPDAWEDVMTLSLDGEGRLVIIRVTPNLWPSGTTSTYRLIYRKLQQ